MRDCATFLLCVFLVVRAAATGDSDTSSQACIGETGDKGDYGHPGSPGLRGYNGDKGETGSSGSDGVKGNQGIRGPPGVRGSVGPPGVMGATGYGKAGPQGPRGNPGSQGPVGPPGLPGLKGGDGDKGDKGNLGTTGVAGADGTPGPPGHRGPTGTTGSKGEMGLRGDPGHKGEQGRQGVPGPSIDAQTLKEYFEPVKTLRQEVSSLKSTIDVELEKMNRSLLAQINRIGHDSTAPRENPAVHLSGAGRSYGYYSSGTVTQWYSSSGSVWSPFLRGGMEYRDGVITVPNDGLYYVYVQMYYEQRSSSYRYAGFRIRVNGAGRAYAFRYHQQVNDYHTHYMGRVIQLNKGDKLSVTFENNCYYYFTSEDTFFGAMSVN